MCDDRASATVTVLMAREREEPALVGRSRSSDRPTSHSCSAGRSEAGASLERRFQTELAAELLDGSELSVGSHHPRRPSGRQGCTATTYCGARTAVTPAQAWSGGDAR